MQLAIALVTLTVSLGIALLTYRKNPRSGTNVYFTLLVLLIGIYPVCNYLAIHASSNEVALYWAKVILLVSIPQGPLLYFFARTYPSNGFIFHKRLQSAIIAWVILNLILAMAGMIFKHVSVQDGTVDIQPGPLVPSFGLLHASTIIAGLVTLFSKYRHAEGRNRRQLALISYGITVSFTLTFLITFILPVVLKSTVLLAVSPLFLALAIAVAAYAIIAQRLFNIQAAVARSVAYTLTLVSLAAVYFIATFAASSLLFGISISMKTQLTYIVLALLLAASFQPIKKMFDRATNELFYQDAYDTQAFLDQLNRALVANNELEDLLNACSQTIASNMRLKYCLFGIKESGFEGIRIIGTTKRDFSATEILAARRTTPRLGTNVIITDDLPPEADKLKQILIKNDIAALVRLVPEFASNQEGLGYIILGQKQSGSMYTSQDVQLLGIIANALVIATQNALHFEEIQAFNVTLQERINDATRKLRNTNERLKLLDETKDDFISMASHQLRTPLTSVKGYISLVLDGDAGAIKPNQRKLLTQAFISSQRMVYLIADLLNVSRLRTGKFIIEPTPVNLADIVQEEVNQLVETAAGRSLQLTYHKPAHFPVLNLDETKIRQVIMNFADNAIYYTPAGGHIEIRLAETPKAVELRVVDDGIGVPKDEQHHLFTKFYRAKNAQKARPDGTGLGLFMAQKVVVGQGGAIIFSSKEGKGSTFGFTFPKDKLQVPSTSENKPA